MHKIQFLVGSIASQICLSKKVDVMLVDIEEIKSTDFLKHKDLPAPTKRAAYSDTTAWLMAVMSELAYVKFEEEEQESLIQIAGELAEITDENEVRDKLVVLKDRVRSGSIRASNETWV